jgi:hypothetical protein
MAVTAQQTKESYGLAFLRALNRGTQVPWPLKRLFRAWEASSWALVRIGIRNSSTRYRIRRAGHRNRPSYLGIQVYEFSKPFVIHGGRTSDIAQT